VEESVPHVQATELHRIALLALEREGADDAELAHHAVGAGDAEATLRYALRAGHTAAARSAHREATIQFKRALAHADRLTPAERAALEEAVAESLSIRDEWAEAEDHWVHAIEIQRTLGNPADLSRCLRRFSLCLWRLCRTEEYRAAERESFELMRDADDSVERALAFYMRGNSDSIPLEERYPVLDECARIAKDLGDESLTARALVGQAFVASDTGVVDYEALDEALEHASRSKDGLPAPARQVQRGLRRGPHLPARPRAAHLQRVHAWFAGDRADAPRPQRRGDRGRTDDDAGNHLAGQLDAPGHRARRRWLPEGPTRGSDLARGDLAARDGQRRDVLVGPGRRGGGAGRLADG
jgi:tetratricopeptide (TPR) repeat protein